MSNSTAPQFVWDHELPATQQSGPIWLFEGLVARAAVTLLTSQWKAGKTTLLSMLLARRAGGGALAGLAVAAGKTVVVTEESEAIWADRARIYSFGGQVCFVPRPFLGVPNRDEWQALIERIRALQQTHGVDLVVIDPLAPFLECENNARAMLDSLLPLTALTRAQMSVLLLHHPGKGAHPFGQAARGSGALLGHVDVAIEMRHPGGDPMTRRRRLQSLSRFTDTPRQLLLELNADATDYVVVSEEGDHGNDFEAFADAFRMVLEDAPQKLTRDDILAEWPTDFNKPAVSTLKRWLSRAVAVGELACEGTGRKSDPYRYWFPASEARWREQVFMYDRFEQQRRELGLPFQSLQERKAKQQRDHDLGIPGGEDD
jgi:hypothetical protein